MGVEPTYLPAPAGRSKARRVAVLIHELRAPCWSCAFGPWSHSEHPYCLTTINFAAHCLTQIVALRKWLPQLKYYREPESPPGPDRINSDSDTGPIPDRQTRGRTGDRANDDLALRPSRKPAAQTSLLGLVVPWVFLCTLGPQTINIQQVKLL